MKKIKITFLFILLLICSFPSLSFASGNQNPNWQVSISQFNVSGNFDYVLYYSGLDTQAISRVNLPQNQGMMICEGVYYLPNHFFVAFQYGDSGFGAKGRGSDSDWTVFGSNAVTDYGELDAYGRQQILRADLGRALLENGCQKVSLFLGWGMESTSNELRNVVYHLNNGIDLGDISQPDNGSFLNGTYNGLRVGIRDEILLRSGLIFTLEATLLHQSARAEGHWANHDPAWNWEDTGSAMGYSVYMGLKYVFFRHLVSEFGGFYTFNKAEGCTEVLNDQVLDQPVGLKYEQNGIWFSLSYRF